MDSAYEEIISLIEKKKVPNHDFLEIVKAEISGKYRLPRIMKNADIILYMDNNGLHKKEVKNFLKTKPVRSLSGVANVAIMWLGEGNYSCPFFCIFCPQGSAEIGKAVPKAYIGTEPTTRRAIRNNYDPWKQVKSRLFQLQTTGHPTDKCELIIMGGTFMSWKKELREDFIKRSFDAFNETESPSFEDAKKANETAKNRVIGLTIETRADYCSSNYIDEMLHYGATRVEVGVQTTDEKLQKMINRGHGCEKNKEAFARLKDAGLKITAHWMPGLTGLNGKINFEKELETFRELFTNPDYRPDELKIYATLVIPGTELYEKWKKGEYEALDNEKMIQLLIELKKYVPKYVRIKRIMRDISEHEAAAGARTTNLRQLAKERAVLCKCIRCREVGIMGKAPEKVTLDIIEYEASGGREFFLSFEDFKNDILIGFLRLRINGSDTARVREIHIYGQQTRIGDKGNYQHKGYGRKLLEKAEEISKSNGKNKIAVTSGVGARKYYEKLGYDLEGYYMTKTLISNFLQ